MNRLLRSANVEMGEVTTDRALERSRRLCAQDMAVVNPAEGCLCDCLFCPVRRRSRELTRISLRSNLPGMLERELTTRRRLGTLPDKVLFNTHTDSFQPVGPLLSLTHEAMQVVLDAGCDLYFITRGLVPKSFDELFSRYPGKVHAQVSFFSLDGNLVSLFEPHAPSPQERLESVFRMMEWGVETRGRLEPLIPFLSDTVGHLEELIRHLRSAGVMKCSAAYLVLRPNMLELFQQALPAAHYHLIRGSFQGQAWQKVGIHQMTKHLPEQIRLQGYQRLSKIGRRFGVDVTVCACMNLEMDGAHLYRSCLAPVVPDANGLQEQQQLELFQP